MTLGAPFVDQSTRRATSLITPLPFDVDLGTGATSVYVGILAKFFLIRAISVCNTTASPINLTVTKNGSDWVTAHPIPANTTESVEGLGGILISDSQSITALGSGAGLTLFGWGLRIDGGDSWIL